MNEKQGRCEPSLEFDHIRNRLSFVCEGRRYVLGIVTRASTRRRRGEDPGFDAQLLPTIAITDEYGDILAKPYRGDPDLGHSKIDMGALSAALEKERKVAARTERTRLRQAVEDVFKTRG